MASPWARRAFPESAIAPQIGTADGGEHDSNNDICWFDENWIRDVLYANSVDTGANCGTHFVPFTSDIE